MAISKKKERCPDGSRDVNVFDIQQGVAIGLFIKEPEKSQPARVHYADLWGERGNKYKFLWSQDVQTTEWQDVNPESPFYFFFPQDPNLKAEYDKSWKVTDIMNTNVLGFQSHRDHFAVAFEHAEISRRIKDLRDKELSESELRTKYRLEDNRDWNLHNARQILREDEHWDEKNIECVYRPFDKRYCYFSEAAMDYPRRELLTHVAHRENLCLNTVRQTKASHWHHAGGVQLPSAGPFSSRLRTLEPLSALPLSRRGRTRSSAAFAHHRAHLAGRQGWQSAKSVARIYC